MSNSTDSSASAAAVTTDFVKPTDSTILFFQIVNVSAFVVCIILQKLHEKVAVTNLI